MINSTFYNFQTRKRVKRRPTQRLRSPDSRITTDKQGRVAVVYCCWQKLWTFGQHTTSTFSVVSREGRSSIVLAEDRPCLREIAQHVKDSSCLRFYLSSGVWLSHNSKFISVGSLWLTVAMILGFKCVYNVNNGSSFWTSHPKWNHFLFKRVFKSE